MFFLKYQMFCSLLLVLYKQDITDGAIFGCKPEDGYFQCSSGNQCVFRRKVLNFFRDCDDGSDQITPLNCTDDEIMDRLFDRCVNKRDSVAEVSLHNLCDPERDFICTTTKKCLERWRVRDNKSDCRVYITQDSSDEDAPLPFCLDTEFSCSGDNANNSQRCIPREWVNDRNTDCPESGLDEKVVLSKCYYETEFRCAERCIPRYRVKDQTLDCWDLSDERTTLECYKEFEFRCKDSGRCIPRSWRGNNITDCPDGSDEEPLLLGEECKVGEVRCNNNRRCIPESFLCDGIDQCGDCSDEIENCNGIQQMFRCPNDPNGKCVNIQYSCDGVSDCPNNTDDITSIAGFKCSRNLAGSVQQRYCVIPQSSLHDDVIQCDDESDLCFLKNGTFVCNLCLDNKTIIAPRQMCDGIFDCPDLSDECLCEDRIVASARSQFLCGNVCYDDNSVACQNCASGEIFCKEENICLQQKQICDGKEDCSSSGDDEKFCNQVFDMQLNVTNNTFVCDIIPTPAYVFLQMLQLTELLTLLRNSETAKECDGIIECPYFEDECSERANCSTRMKICDEIPLVKTDLSNVGPHFTSLFGLSVKGIDSFWARKCEGLVEYVIGKSICNGIKECRSGLDERFCPDRFYCDAGEVSGYSYTPLPRVSLAREKVCDGIPDCLDQSDERNSSDPRDKNCSNHFYCTGGKTLFATDAQVLNGVADCDDESDECPEYYLSDSAISSNKFLIVSTALEFFLWMMALFALAGNGTVILTTGRFILNSRKKSLDKKPRPSLMINKLMILNLAVADFLMGIALLIIIVKTREYSGDYCLRDKAWRTSSTCSAVGVITVLSSEVSVLTLVCLTSYRLYHIVYPYRSREANVTFLGVWILLIWLLSIVLAVAPILRIFSLTMVTTMWIEQNHLFRNDTVNFAALKQFAQRLITLTASQEQNQSIYQDWYTLQNFFENDITGEAPIARGYFGYYSASGLCIPRFYRTVNEDSDLNALSPTVIIFNFVALVYIAMAYAVIYRRTTSHRLVGEGQRTDQQRKQARTLQHKVTILIATDMICWLPICIMTFVSVGGVALLPEAYAVSAILLLPINSSINPLIYTNALSTALRHVSGWFDFIVSKLQTKTN